MRPHKISHKIMGDFNYYPRYEISYNIFTPVDITFNPNQLIIIKYYTDLSYGRFPHR